MKIYIKSFTRYRNYNPKDYISPSIILTKDNWDDFGYKTYHYLSYITKAGELIDIGSVRILDRNSSRTTLTTSDDGLSDEFCSLGTSLDYYEIIGNLLEGETRDILVALNDVVFNENIYEEFKELEGFNNSLLRDIASRSALENGKNVLNSIFDKKSYNFTYSTILDDATDPHEIEFDFNSKDVLPYRVVCIIGKNGTGKTQVLSNLAEDMTSAYNTNIEKFKNEKPVFGKLISISYSAFGGFKKKKANSEDQFSYENFGVLDEKNSYNKEYMTKRLGKSIENILKLKREDTWLSILAEFNNEDFINIIKENIIEKKNLSTLQRLSSGQRMIFEIVTNIIGSIRKNTLILFDEPEIHLHPNAIALLMKALYMILDVYDSFAIIATHVPQVIQQVPSKSVIVFERHSNTPLVSTLAVESFGENLSTITNDVFQISEVFDNYKNVFKELALKHGYEDILSFFKTELSLNARVYLNSLYEEE